MYRTRLYELRDKKEFSQDFVAKQINVPRRTYAGWESDRIIPLEYLIKLAKFYNVSLDYMLYNSNNPSIGNNIKSFNPNKIHSNIRKFRKALGLSEEEFAVKVHVNQSTVSKWENSNIEIKVDNIKLIANILNTTINDLVGV